jgi:Ran GTPase-activating protein (RanGAP) involved in mRNA processing and transport
MDTIYTQTLTDGILTRLEANTVRKLDIANGDIKDEAASRVAHALKANTTLKTLKLWGNGITHIGAGDISRILNTTGITKLCLGCNQLSDDGTAAIAGMLKSNTSLTFLDLRSCGIECDGAKELADAISVNTVLETIILDSNRIGNDGLTKLASALSVSKTLKYMMLASNFFNDIGIKHLANALKINKSLTSIRLSNNFIRDDGGYHIGDALPYCNLTEIELNSCHIKKGANWLAAGLVENSTISTINLSNNKMAKGDADILAEMLKNNTAIRTLDVSGNHIDRKAISAIREFLRRNIRRYEYAQTILARMALTIAFTRANRSNDLKYMGLQQFVQTPIMEMIGDARRKDEIFAGKQSAFSHTLFFTHSVFYGN